MRFKNSVLLIAGLLALPLPALAQTAPSLLPPFNTDVNSVLSLSAAVPATTPSAAQVNQDKVGVACTFIVTAESGSPSVTLLIEQYNAGVQTLTSGSPVPATLPATSWTALVASAGTPNAFNVPNTIIVSPGIQTTSLPTNVTASVNLHLPRFWRAKLVTTGASTTTTANVGCDYLR